MSGAPRRPGGFGLLERVGDPRDLVLHPPQTAGERLAVFAKPTLGAVVLGSTQRLDVIDPRAAALAAMEIVRRRSGGGAVFVAPSAQIWLDLFIPTGDPLFRHDVGHAAVLVGEIWRQALVTAFDDPARNLALHTRGLVVSRFSSLVCFSGLGPGEITLDGRKLVGLSQRRDRTGAWFFTLAYLAFAPELHGLLLAALSDADRVALVGELQQRVAVLGEHATRVEEVLRAELG